MMSSAHVKELESQLFKCASCNEFFVENRGELCGECQGKNENCGPFKIKHCYQRPSDRERTRKKGVDIDSGSKLAPTSPGFSSSSEAQTDNILETPSNSTMYPTSSEQVAERISADEAKTLLENLPPVDIEISRRAARNIAKAIDWFCNYRKIELSKEEFTELREAQFKFAEAGVSRID